MMAVKKELNKYRKDAITAARELYYPQEVVKKIQKAETEDEISKIMFNARMKKYA